MEGQNRYRNRLLCRLVFFGIIGNYVSIRVELMLAQLKSSQSISDTGGVVQEPQHFNAKSTDELHHILTAHRDTGQTDGKE